MEKFIRNSRCPFSKMTPERIAEISYDELRNMPFQIVEGPIRSVSINQEMPIELERDVFDMYVVLGEKPVSCAVVSNMGISRGYLNSAPVRNILQRYGETHNDQVVTFSLPDPGAPTASGENLEETYAADGFKLPGPAISVFYTRQSALDKLAETTR